MEKKLNGKTKNTIKNDKKTKADDYLDPITKKFKLGNPGGGRPEGTLDFKTRWFNFMERMAKEKGVEVSDLDKQQLIVAYNEMQSGKFPYWKDINDRLYGQANQPIDMGVKPELQQALEKLSQIIK